MALRNANSRIGNIANSRIGNIANSRIRNIANSRIIVQSSQFMLVYFTAVVIGFTYERICSTYNRLIAGSEA